MNPIGQPVTGDAELGDLIAYRDHAYLVTAVHTPPAREMRRYTIMHTESGQTLLSNLDHPDWTLI